MTNLIPQLLKYFMENYGFKMNDSSDYVGVNNTGGRYIPLDEKLGIRKKHTPGFNYFFSSFIGVSEIVYDFKRTLQNAA